MLIAGCGTGWHSDWNRAEIRRRAGARRRSQPEQPGLRQTQDAAALAVAHRLCASRHSQARIARPQLRRDRRQRRAASHGRSDGGLAHLALAAAARRLHASRILQRTRAPRRGGGARLDRRARLWPTPADIRRCRQDLLGDAAAQALPASAIFSAPANAATCCSTCRKAALTIPEIKGFLAEHGIEIPRLRIRRARRCSNAARCSPTAGWSMSDLDRWHAVENRIPGYIFGHVPQFWVQKG